MTGLKQKARDFLRLRAFLWGDVIAVGVAACVATCLGFFGAWNWFADLFSHFRVQYFLVLSAVAMLLLLPRRRRTAACFGLAALVNLATILPLYFGRSDPVATARPPLRAMLLNVNRQLGHPARVADAVQRFDPDVVVLEEVDEEWLRELASSLRPYPHSTVEPRADNFGIALYSKLPLSRAEVLYLSEAHVPSIVAELEAGRERFTVIATHPVPPSGARYSRWRNDQFDGLPDQVRAASSPVLLLGDPNVSPWSPHFKRLLQRTGLGDSSRGQGVQPTWPTHNPLLWIPIDHCLHAPEIHVVQRRVGGRVGSDHYPLIVDFIVQPRPTAP